MNTVDKELIDIDKELLNEVSDLKELQNGVYNVRKNGTAVMRKITDDVRIITKEDASGIDIYVDDNTPLAFIYIPVIITKSGLNDIVYNDFHIGKNAKATIVAGCAIHNDGKEESRHEGIHRFFLEEGADVTYLEKHYGQGHGNHKILDPVTEVFLKKGSTLTMDTVQIKGVDRSIRKTKGILEDDTNFIITEKIMTDSEQYAETHFDIQLNGANSSTHVISRSVATDHSKQRFISNIDGNNKSYAHIECDAIIQDKGSVQAIPSITANHVDANLIHEATIGKIAGEQLLKLMSLGLNEKEAEEAIINGFLK